MVRDLIGTDEDHSLKDFAFGVIDNDNQPKVHDNIFQPERYSIENYVFDPTILYFWFISSDFSSRLFKAECLDELQELKIVLIDGFSHLKSLEDFFSCPSAEKTVFINRILDIFGEKCFAIAKFVVENKVIGTLEHLQQANDFHGDILNNAKENVRCTGGVSLAFPKIMLYLRGHTLAEFFFGKVFCIAGSCISSFVTEIFNSFCQNVKHLCIPEDIVDLFTKLINGKGAVNATMPLEQFYRTLFEKEFYVFSDEETSEIAIIN